ncbi:hypothetical protein [Salipiger sp. PrR002]|uniref:hypothetical protein n=1 Tax=Salipiger sp. PrR002 TaxID=2706489 RepID=UPI0013BA9F23|nr:hypothetical protein [Salipiger sp. PrR002]NDW01927.1 hypothetical protein [Salipiger sp. PrR002]NDW58995.1 hypothetical protein [Salipiger sp. PrR004]
MTWTDSLRNVRTAYRVVAAYQQRTLAMMKLARREFEPLNFACWFATEHDVAPPQRVDPLRKWSWDFVPMQSCAIALNSVGTRYWTIKPGECIVYL